MNADLIELLQRRKRDARVANRAAVVAAWVRDVDDLMVRIRGWLVELRARKLVRVRAMKVVIREERLGSYRSNVLVIAMVDGPVVRIKPAARFVLGAMGRVDMTCNGHVAYLIRTARGRWRIRAREFDPMVPFVPFNEGAFFATLLTWIA